MRALILDAVRGTPAVRDVPTPVPPPGGVVVRVMATGLCRSDWHAWAGHDDIAFPHVPGHELAGVVAAVADDVVAWRVGDRVTVPFVCGATNLGEALRRITEGAAMIRSKGEAGTGDVSEATKHIRTITGEIRRLRGLSKDELYVAAKELQAPYELVAEVAERGALPVVLFTAGGVATPADAALMMQLGADGVFVGSGIFKSGQPERRAAAIVKATAAFDDPKAIAAASRGLGEAMVGINVSDLPAPHRLAERGW